MVNGVVTPTLNSHAQMIRLRILNASNARTYRLGFSDNRPFFIIGSDGGILDTVSTVIRLDMSPAERYEIVVDFSNANGSTLKMMAFNSEIDSHTYPNGLSGNIYWISPLLDDYDTSDFEIMTFDIGNPTTNAVTSFNQELTEIVRVDPETADNVNNPRPFVLAAPVGSGNGFTINGSMFDASIVDDVINLGALEVWDIENTANMAHPFHIHGNSFQVVSRTNGVRPTHDYELGWKDVVIVYSQETVRIIKSFEDYADPEGPYMSHCHILEHEDVGMMTHWVVVDQPIGIQEPNQPNPSHFTLYNNFPNPFNPTTTIEFSIPQTEFVTVKVYNIAGHEITTLINDELSIGNHSIQWNGSHQPSGVYFVKIESGGFVQTRKMVLLK